MAASPGLIPVLEADLSAQNPIVIFPLLQAQSLSNWLDSRSQIPSQLRLIKLSRQLIETLTVIHQTGMAHSQIDMAHVLVTDFDESLRLVGFSCLEPIGKFTQLPRSASYFDAPEVRNGFFEVSSATDVYAAGKVMIELFGHKAASWPIVQAMTASRANDRPTSSELLVLLKDLECRLSGNCYKTSETLSRAA